SKIFFITLEKVSCNCLQTICSISFKFGYFVIFFSMRDTPFSVMVVLVDYHSTKEYPLFHYICFFPTALPLACPFIRSEERRVGKECSFWCSAVHGIGR